MKRIWMLALLLLALVPAAWAGDASTLTVKAPLPSAGPGTVECMLLNPSGRVVAKGSSLGDAVTLPAIPPGVYRLRVAATTRNVPKGVTWESSLTLTGGPQTFTVPTWNRLVRLGYADAAGNPYPQRSPVMHVRIDGAAEDASAGAWAASFAGAADRWSHPLALAQGRDHTVEVWLDDGHRTRFQVSASQLSNPGPDALTFLLPYPAAPGGASHAANVPIDESPEDPSRGAVVPHLANDRKRPVQMVPWQGTGH